MSWDCQEQLFRQEVENSDDIRLNRPLFNDCRGDQQKFCPDVMLGSNRVKDCLEDHREDKAFSSECKASLEALLARRASDFRLVRNPSCHAAPPLQYLQYLNLH